MNSCDEWSLLLNGKAPPSVGSSDWGELTVLTHTTHKRPAFRIAEDRAIIGGLVQNGKLRSTRTEVVYFSPNTWDAGSRYGPIAFSVDWETLIDGRKLYWVETNYSYQIPTYRFLISKQSASAVALSAYDPTVDKGPIQKIGAIWYWARGYAAEVMIDEAVPLSAVRSVDLEKHHDKFCSNHNCVERGSFGSRQAHREFMAGLVGSEERSLNTLMMDGDKISFVPKAHLVDLYMLLVEGNTFSGTVNDNATAQSLMKAACLTFYGGFKERAKGLVSLIDNKARAEEGLKEIIRAHFELSLFEWEPF